MISKVTKKIQDILFQRKKLRFQKQNNPDKKSFPVFLVGLGRSGTNLIMEKLSLSLKTDMYNEYHPAAFQNWRIKNMEVIAGIIENSWGRAVVFKPIVDTYKTRLFLTRFPSSKILFAFRHYHDVVNSMLHKFGGKNRDAVENWIRTGFQGFADAPPSGRTIKLLERLFRPGISAEDGTALCWLFFNRLYFDMNLDSEPRVLPVCYEKLVENPFEEFKTLFRFLGLELPSRVEKGITKGSVGKNEPPRLTPSIQEECSRLWKKLNRAASNRSGGSDG